MENENCLISKAQAGDKQAFRKLVERNRQFVFSLAYDLTGDMHEAEDLMQEVFIRLFRSISGFRGEAKLSTWLYRVTCNTWTGIARSGPFRLRTYSDAIDAEAISETVMRDKRKTSNPEHCAETAFIRDHITKALDCLSPNERKAFTLKHFQELQISEISEIMNVADGTIKSLLFRAVHKLRKRLAFLRPDTDERSAV